MEYRKYKFSSAQWNSLRALIVNERGYYTNCDVADLGLEIDTPATVSSEGEVIEPATYTDNIRVDILWHGTSMSEFIPYEVWPSGVGVHVFAGLENEYLEAYNNRTV